MFQLSIGEIYFGYLEFILLLVSCVLAIELHSPITKGFLWPADDFDTNVLATFAFDMRKKTFFFLRQFPYGVRTFENAGRRYPPLPNQILTKTCWTNKHEKLYKNYWLKIRQNAKN